MALSPTDGRRYNGTIIAEKHTGITGCLSPKYTIRWVHPGGVRGEGVKCHSCDGTGHTDELEWRESDGGFNFEKCGDCGGNKTTDSDVYHCEIITILPKDTDLSVV